MKELIHFDPINLLIVIVGFGAFWYKFFRSHDKLVDTVSAQAEWTQIHDRECDEQRRANMQILTEIQKVNSRLTTLTEAHEKRIDRLENQADRVAAGVGR